MSSALSSCVLSYPLSPAAVDRVCHLCCDISPPRVASAVIHTVAVAQLNALGHDETPTDSEVYTTFLRHFFARCSSSEFGNQTVSEWCLSLLCIGYDAEEYLRLIRHANIGVSALIGGGRRCDKQWFEGELAYTCAQCQSDPQCAVCVECFQRSDHRGHEFAIVVTGGGFCDCGDEQAWDRNGTCDRHSAVSAAALADGIVDDGDALTDLELSDAADDADGDVDGDDDEWSDDAEEPQRRRRRPQSLTTPIGLTSLTPATTNASSLSAVFASLLPPSHPMPQCVSVPISAQCFTADRLLQVRIRTLLSAVVEYVCRTINSLGALPTHQRRFASVVKVLSWIRKLCRGGSVFHSALAHALIEKHDADMTRLSFLFSHCSLPAPIHSPSRLDRVMCEIAVGLLSQVATTIKPVLVRAYMTHYITLHYAKSRLPQLISVQLLAVPALSDDLIVVGAERTLIAALYSTLVKTAHSNANRGSADPIRVRTDRAQTIDCNHPMLLAQSHYALKIDLIYILRHKRVAIRCLTVGRVCAVFLDVLALLQRMNAIQRVHGGHVEFETDEWQYAFELEHDIQQIVELLTKALTPNQTQVNDAPQSSLVSLTRAYNQSDATTNAHTQPTAHTQTQQMTNNAAAITVPLSTVGVSLSSAASSSSSSSLHSCYKCSSSAAASVSLSSLRRLLSMCGYKLAAELIDDGIASSSDCVPVSAGWTSFHLPLHRIMSRIAAIAMCAYGLSVADVAESMMANVSAPLRSCYWRAVAHCPLRLSAVCAQMRAKLWIRNGESVLGQQACYRSPSFALPGLYSDAFAMQLAAVNGDVDEFIASAIDAFELSEWRAPRDRFHSVSGPTPSPSTSPSPYPQLEDDDRRFPLLWTDVAIASLSPPQSPLSPPLRPLVMNNVVLTQHEQCVLLEELLRLLIHLVTDRTLLTCDHIHIRTELLHALAVHSAPTHSSLLASLPEPIARQTRSVDAILALISDFHPPAGTKGGTYTLAAAAWNEFNPFFIRYMNHELAHSDERFRQHKSKTQTHFDAANVAPHNPHNAEFDRLLLLLHAHTLHELLHNIIRAADNKQNHLSPQTSAAFSRSIQSALHLVSLALITLPDIDDSASAVFVRRLPLSSALSTNMCLPFDVQRFAHRIRTRAADETSPSAVPMPTAMSRRSRRSLSQLVRALTAAVESSAFSEHRGAADDLNVIATVRLTRHTTRDADAPTNESTAERKLNAVSMDDTHINPPSLMPTAADQRSAALAAAKRRQSSHVAMFQEKIVRFLQTNKTQNKTQQNVTTEPQPQPQPAAQASTLAPLTNSASAAASAAASSSLNKKATKPELADSHRSDTPAPQSVTIAVSATASSAATTSTTPLPHPSLSSYGIETDSECGLCREPASSSRLMGVIAYVTHSGLDKIRHRQQCKRLAYRLLHRQIGNPIAVFATSPAARNERRSSASVFHLNSHSFPPSQTADVLSQPSSSSSSYRVRRRVRPRTFRETPDSSAQRSESSETLSPVNANRKRKAAALGTADDSSNTRNVRPHRGSSSAAFHPFDYGFDWSHAHMTTRVQIDSDSPSDSSAQIIAVPPAPPLHLTSCGHFIHFDCIRRYLYHSPTAHAANKTFACPTCRTMSNVLLPIPTTRHHNKPAEQQTNKQRTPHADTPTPMTGNTQRTSLERLFNENAANAIDDELHWLKRTTADDADADAGSGTVSGFPLSRVPFSYVVACEALFAHLCSVVPLDLNAVAPVLERCYPDAVFSPRSASDDVKQVAITSFRHNVNNAAITPQTPAASAAPYPTHSHGGSHLFTVKSASHVSSLPIYASLQSFPLTALPFSGAACLARMSALLSIVALSFVEWESALRHPTAPIKRSALNVDRFDVEMAMALNAETQQRGDANANQIVIERVIDDARSGVSQPPPPPKSLSFVLSLAAIAPADDGVPSDAALSALASLRSSKTAQTMRILLFVYRTMRFIYLYETTAHTPTDLVDTSGVRSHPLANRCPDHFADVLPLWNELIGTSDDATGAAPILSANVFGLLVRFTPLILDWKRRVVERIVALTFAAKITQSVLALTAINKRSAKKSAQFVAAFAAECDDEQVNDDVVTPHTNALPQPPLSSELAHASPVSSALPPRRKRKTRTDADDGDGDGDGDGGGEGANASPLPVSSDSDPNSDSEQLPPLSPSPPPSPSASPALTHSTIRDDDSALSDVCKALLETASADDICCLETLYLFLQAARRGLVKLDAHFDQHCATQLNKQRALAEHASAQWTSLTRFVSSRDVAAAVNELCTPFRRQATLFLSSAIEVETSQTPSTGNADWYAQLFVDVATLSHSAHTHHTRTASPYFGATLRRLIYGWLRAHRDALRSTSAPIPPLVADLSRDDSVPCAAIDIGRPLSCFGLPRVFQSLLHPPHHRQCPHCRTHRSAHSTHHHITSLLLCLFCGEYVCATSKAKCHLNHIALCEGARGVFLSIKRGDVILIKTNTQQNAVSSYNGAAALSQRSSSVHRDADVLSLNRRSLPLPRVISQSNDSASLTPTYSFCHWPSLYLDVYGEADLNLTRGRPLYLSSIRCSALIELIAKHRIDDFINAHQYNHNAQQNNFHLIQQQQMTQQTPPPPPPPPVAVAAVAAAASVDGAASSSSASMPPPQSRASASVDPPASSSRLISMAQSAPTAPVMPSPSPSPSSSPSSSPSAPLSPPLHHHHHHHHHHHTHNAATHDQTHEEMQNRLIAIHNALQTQVATAMQLQMSIMQLNQQHQQQHAHAHAHAHAAPNALQLSLPLPIPLPLPVFAAAPSTHDNSNAQSPSDTNHVSADEEDERTPGRRDVSR